MPADRLITLVSKFPPVSLPEMDGVKLLDRTDTKYLTDEETLPAILEDAAAAGYRALTIGSSGINRYESRYYDTAGLKMFLDHRNRRLVRQKIRTRKYVEYGQAFLEIKRKNNKGRTKKKRMEIPSSELMDFRSDAAACSFLAEKSAFSPEELSPALSTGFVRITLVNPSMTERTTIDTGVEFRNFRTGREASLKNAVVIEVKQDGRYASGMREILLRRRVKPFRISKYCMAVTLTDPSARAGRFNEKRHMIEKLIGNKL